MVLSWWLDGETGPASRLVTVIQNLTLSPRKVFGGIVWRRFFFVLNHEGTLYVLKNDHTTRVAEQIDIANVSFRRSWVRLNSIRIDRPDEPPVFLCADDPNELCAWISSFGRVGADFVNLVQGEPSVDDESDVPEFSRRAPRSWTSDDVRHWLSFVHQPVNVPIQNGKHLLRLTDPKLQALGEMNRDVRVALIAWIGRLREFGFDFGRAYVGCKIHKMLDGKLGELMGCSIDVAAANLSEPERMLETYLRPDIRERDLIVTYDDLDTEQDDLIRIREDFPSDEYCDEVEANVFNLSPLELEDTSFEDLDGIRVRVLIAEGGVYPRSLQTARRLVSPIRDYLMHFSSEFGIFRSTVVVGPWILSWENSSSLVIPHKISPQMGMIVEEIDVLGVSTKDMSLSEISSRLAEVVCRWNRTRLYNCRKNPEVPQIGNCQDFVDDVLSALDVQFDSEGCLASYLDRMRLVGACEMIFQPTESFREAFKLPTNTEHRFDSHAELDDFVVRLGEVDQIRLQCEFKASLSLLKAFDRAFWLRHLKHPEYEKFKPSQSQCPFSDPRS